MRPRRAVIALFVVVFSLAVVYLVYEGATRGNYLLVALASVAYVFVLMLEVALSMRKSSPVRRPPRPPPAKRAFCTEVQTESRTVIYERAF